MSQKKANIPWISWGVTEDTLRALPLFDHHDGLQLKWAVLFHVAVCWGKFRIIILASFLSILAISQESYSAFEYEGVVRGLKVNSRIEAVRKKSDVVIADMKAIVEATLEGGSKFEEFLGYYDSVFPRGEPLPIDDPLYCDPGALVDIFDPPDGDGNYFPLGPTSKLAIQAGRRGIENIIAFATQPESVWNTRLRYALVRLLVHLRAQGASPHTILTLVRTMAAAGQHCGPGNMGVIEDLLKVLGAPPDPLWAASVLTFRSTILAALDRLREEIFDDTVSFAKDPQPVHTKNFYRGEVYAILKIDPPFADPYPYVARHWPFKEEVIENFFRGKGRRESFPDSPDFLKAEDDRVHRGYTPQVIAKAVE